MPKEEGHEQEQIGDGDDTSNTADRPRNSGSPIVGNEQERPTATNDKYRNQDTGLRLAGFNVPLPQPIRGVKNDAQMVLRKLDGRLGGERLAINTNFSAAQRNKQTPATATVPGPPVNDDDDNNDNDDIEMNDRSPTHDHPTTHTDKDDSDEIDFAVPGGPGIRPRDMGREGDPDAFNHPASKEPQRIIWLPRDELGLCVAEVEKNREFGVESSWRHARLTHNGKVRISGRPPGYR